MGHVAISPIQDNVDLSLPALVSRVPPGGRILGVRNRPTDRTRLDAAEAALFGLEVVIDELEPRSPA